MEKYNKYCILQISKEQMILEIKNTDPFTLESKNIKYLGII